MKKIALQSFAIILVCGIFIFVIPSCKKEHANPSTPPPVDTSTVPHNLSDADSLKYLMYNYMQVTFIDGGRDTSYDLPTYYWYKSVPKLNPLSSEYDSAEVLLNKIKSYPVNPATQKLFDKYSFIDKGEVAGEIQQGVAGDLGMQVSYALDKSGKTHLLVLFADKNSPSGLAGVKRGDEITAVNGSTDVSYDGSNGPNVTKVTKAVYDDASASFTFKQPDGKSFTTTLTKAVYNINPVLFDTVYSIGAKKVGYFVFNSFAAVENQTGPTLTKQEISRVFNKFQTSAISDLIVDLRYNGGGSVGTAEFLDSLIAPASVKGKEMYHYIYNDKLTAVASQAGLEDKVLFKGGGSLNLTNVFFIGGQYTASASELTINNLKPYMNVKLVGDTTYGKPVGFFSFRITDYPNGGTQQKFLADLYAINFETRNAADKGGYFDGLIPDKVATDFIDLPWGDPKDDNLANIFNYISTRSFKRVSVTERMAEDNSLRMLMPSTTIPLRFNGMVDYQQVNRINVAVKKLRKIK